MNTRNLVVVLTAALSLVLGAGLVGCGDDDGGTNDNNDNTNTPAVHLDDELVTTSAGEPDVTCEGTTDPALSYSVETEISGIVNDFEEDWAVEGVLVSVYSSVQDLLDDNPYDTSAASAPNGSYSVLAPPNVPRLHFMIWDPSADPDYFVTMELNEPVAGMPPGPPQATGKDRLAVSAVTMATVPAILGLQRIEGRGIISGRVFDCDQLEIENAALRAYDGPESDPQRQLLSVYEGPHRNSFYFPAGGSIPGRDPMFTDPEGRFITANLVANPGEFITLEAWGRTTACPDGCLMSTQELPVLPDSIVITDMLPLYSE